MKKITIAIVVLVGISFSSCVDVVPGIDPTEGGTKILPLKITEENDITNFTYDSQNRFTEIKEENENTTDYTLSTFKYEADKLMSVKVEVKSADYSSVTDYTFSYANNTVNTKVKFSSNGVDEEMEEVLTIDATGRLISYDGISLDYDSSGNVNIISYPSEQMLFQYDYLNGIFKNVKTPQWVLVYVLDKYYTNYSNNVEQVMFKDFEDGEESKVNISYEFNKFLYPSKMIVTDEDNESYVSTIEYNSKME